MNLAAYTSFELSPPCISVNLVNGKVRIDVRSPAPEGAVYGSQGYIDLTVEQYREIVTGSLKKLEEACST